MPGTAYLEMALEAANDVLPAESYVLKSVSIQRPLVFPEDDVETIQIVLRPAGADTFTFEICSLKHDEVGEHEHGGVLARIGAGTMRRRARFSR